MICKTAVMNHGFYGLVQCPHSSVQPLVRDDSATVDRTVSFKVSGRPEDIIVEYQRPSLNRDRDNRLFSLYHLQLVSEPLSWDYFVMYSINIVLFMVEFRWYRSMFHSCEVYCFNTLSEFESNEEYHMTDDVWSFKHLVLQKVLHSVLQLNFVIRRIRKEENN